jgi:Cdc6-like AAA superfamily ATPase
MAAAVAGVKARFPGREAQIHELARCLLAGESERCPVFVSGLTSTGKTAVVRALAGALGLRHAYVNCREASRTRPLLDSVLHQLKGGKRRREEGYEGTVRCDSAAAFLQALPAAAGRRPGPAWIVLDEAQRLAGTDLLTTLLAARETTGADVGLLLISSLPWGGGAFVSPGHSTPPPCQVPFPAYRPEALIKVSCPRAIHPPHAAPASLDSA